MRIVLADDHQLVRDCLRMCLSGVPAIQIVGEADDGPSAIERTLALRPDVLVVDVSLPTLSGTEVARRVIAELGDACRILALSALGDRAVVEEMFRAGASGYVVKSAAYDELVFALQTVGGGRVYVSPSIAGSLIGALVHTQDVASTQPALTPRERDVLRLVADGLNTKEVASVLGISDKTVHALRARLLRKLGMQSVADLTKYAIRRGLSALD